MCRDRRKLRTFVGGDERGWCEEVAPGLYRSLVHHLGGCRIEPALVKLATRGQDSGDNQERGLVWGSLFTGYYEDGSTRSVIPNVIIGIDHSPCDDAEEEEE